LQERVLRDGTSTSFFSDQFRNPIYVGDIVRIVSYLARDPAAAAGHRVLNMGGSERVSRVDIAQAVAAHLSLDGGCIVSAPASSVPLAVASPADISMDSSKLFSIVPFAPLVLREALRFVFV